MNIDKEILRLILEIASTSPKPLAEEQKPSWAGPGPVDPVYDFIPGKNYHVETVTKYFTGRFLCFNGHELVFGECAWIPDIGRAAEAYEKGSFSEVEPFPEKAQVLIGRGSVICAFEIGFNPPRSQK
jgi:hypothetical protein